MTCGQYQCRRGSLLSRFQGLGFVMRCGHGMALKDEELRLDACYPICEFRACALREKCV